MIKFDNKILTDLVQNKITVEQIEIGFLKIGRNINEIDIFEITDIHVNVPTNEEHKFLDSDFTIKERLEKLKNFDGWIHMAGGLSCIIKNQIISAFRLTRKYIEPINYFTREDILHFYGTPDYELIDDISWGIDTSIENYILVYNNKKINFYIDPDKNILKEIYIGILEKEKFTLR